MLNEIGIIKLSKYHHYKNEINFFNKYKNDILMEFGSIDNLPIEVKYNLERTKARLERYALDNRINEISDEILMVNASH